MCGQPSLAPLHDLAPVPCHVETQYESGVTEIDRADLETCLAVLARAEQLPVEHPDAVAVRRATAKIFKTAKELRRAERRAAVAAADRAVLASTATAAPGRIDDETSGIDLTSSAAGASAGTLIRARPCYQCKRKYTEVDAFYHQLCPDCAALNREHREARTSHRASCAADGRAREDRHVHRSATAARRRAHDDHDPLSKGRGAPLRLDARQLRPPPPPDHPRGRSA